MTFDRPVPGVRAYILTHFHSDHYMGLGPSWAAGPIFCTPVTARLVLKRLRVRGASGQPAGPSLCSARALSWPTLQTQVKSEWLRPVPLHSPVVVEGHQLTFFDANHCPGAAVVTLRPAGRQRPLVVHTGDFRAGAELIGALCSCRSEHLVLPVSALTAATDTRRLPPANSAPGDVAVPRL